MEDRGSQFILNLHWNQQFVCFIWNPHGNHVNIIARILKNDLFCDVDIFIHPWLAYLRHFIMLSQLRFVTKVKAIFFLLWRSCFFIEPDNIVEIVNAFSSYRQNVQVHDNHPHFSKQKVLENKTLKIYSSTHWGKWYTLIGPRTFSKSQYSKNTTGAFATSSVLKMESPWKITEEQGSKKRRLGNRTSAYWTGLNKEIDNQMTYKLSETTSPLALELVSLPPPARALLFSPSLPIVLCAKKKNYEKSLWRRQLLKRTPTKRTPTFTF